MILLSAVRFSEVDQRDWGFMVIDYGGFDASVERLWVFLWE